MSAKIYTKTGDKGKTSLLGGSKVSKSDPQITSYGNIDELNAFIGYLHDHEEVDPDIKSQLSLIQNNLFTIGSILATDVGFSGFELPSLNADDIKTLENWIDEMDAELPELKNFILPAGHKIVSLCHVCRTVCRRAERGVSALESVAGLEENVLPYINRLSDYFFTLARKMQNDLQVEEIPWKPRK